MLNAHLSPDVRLTVHPPGYSLVRSANGELPSSVAERSGRWMTLDRWESPVHHPNFAREFGAEYRALDKELEGIAGEAEFIGAFEEGQ